MAVNLADMLKGVSNLGTDREQIEYIDMDLIDDDPNNFYELSGIEELAANIELIGIQQPIRVRPNPDKPERVIIVSGHRRRAASRLLVEEGKTKFRELPCIRDRTETSAAMQELRLIYANSDTRKLSSADLGKQAARVEELLYKLKEEGVEFPGRMRDHVAQACQVSKSKLARLKVIRENLIHELFTLYEDGTIVESVAYALAQQPAELQSAIATYPPLKGAWSEWYVRRAVMSLTQADKYCNPHYPTCVEGCVHREKVLTRMLYVPNSWSSVACENTTCCVKCPNLATCASSCKRAVAKKAKLKRAQKARQEAEAKRQAAEEEPVIAGLQAMWSRFAAAREAAGASVEEVYEAMGRYCTDTGKAKHLECERLEEKFTSGSDTPFGYNLRTVEVRRLTALCDLLDCSLDYLLCRTDVPKLDTSKAPAEGWVPLEWLDGRERPHRFGQKAVGRFEIEGLDRPILQIVRWDGACWNYPKGPAMDGKCVGWFPIPEEV